MPSRCQLRHAVPGVVSSRSFAATLSHPLLSYGTFGMTTMQSYFLPHFWGKHSEAPMALLGLPLDHFIIKILLLEAAVLLVMDDLGCSRANAEECVLASRQYGLDFETAEKQDRRS
jgi:hypothetical protein